MNVILILCDTLRRDHAGGYGGGRAQMPSLDRLASRSVVFDRAFSASYPTLPCRAELFTGRFVYPYLPWGPLPRSEVLLSQLLGDAGYDTVLISDNPQLLRRDYEYDRGFATRIRVRGQLKDDYVTEAVPVTLPCSPEKVNNKNRAIQYLRNASRRRSEQDYCVAQTMAAATRWLASNARRGPFFLMVDCFDPHEPWDPPQPYVDRYDPGYQGEKIFYPRYTSADFYTPPELRHMRALYAAEVSMVDHWLGQLMGCLDDLELWDDTAVIFFSDHGFYLGEHGLVGKMGKLGNIAARAHNLRGWPLYREVTEIPLMICLPGVAARRCPAFVHPGDLMPTILELAGVARPPRVQATSLLPLVRGEAESVRDVAVSSWSLHTWSRFRSSTVWTDEWSLVYWRMGIEPELYHLPSDPDQLRNVYADHRDVARELHGRYVRLLQELGTPLAHYWPRRLLWTIPWGTASADGIYAESNAGRAHPSEQRGRW
jgi:arylsulfatase A-like enzyme